MTASLDAMRIHLERFPNAKQRLPTKKQYTYDEMFFISQAYIDCWATNHLFWITHELHPPRFHRVNRGLSNFDQFQKVFKCKDTDPMVAKTRCSL